MPSAGPAEQIGGGRVWPGLDLRAHPEQTEPAVREAAAACLVPALAAPVAHRRMQQAGASCEPSPCEHGGMCGAGVHAGSHVGGVAFRRF